MAVIASSYITAAQPNEYLRKKSEDLSSGMEVIVGSEKIYCQKMLPEFYQRRDFELAWSAADKKEMIEIIDGASEEGLQPDDYHFETIRQFIARFSTPTEKAELDLLLTDAFLLYASHFLNGKVNPETVDSEWKAIRREGNAREFLERAISKKRIKEDLQSLESQHAGYSALKSALQKYKEIKINGAWSLIPIGETLKIGGADSIRVPLLIDRLLATQDLTQRPSNRIIYSESIAESVKKYQQRNGLETDGNLGKMTTTMLNVSVDERIDQIKINLERYRWISKELGTHYVLVNIADYSMQVLKNEKLTFKEKVIVGKPFRKTPVFSSKMSYMVVNPTWTVPPTILFNDILPEVKKNPGYLATKNIRVLQGQGSSVSIIDPYTIDWTALSRGNFPYILRQDPGPINALGVVKFMFPNQYNVYIHDTPSKELFERSDRAFSSGCIRLNNPLSFAKYLLQEDPKWNEERLNKVIANGMEQSIMLDKPLNVHILYLTSWVDNGQVHFRNDLYQRDKPVLDALNSKPPSF